MFTTLLHPLQGLISTAQSKELRAPGFPEGAQIKEKSQVIVHDYSELLMTN